AHVGVTIQSCAPGVIIEADDGTAPQFVLGLILLEAPRNFTLRGIDFLLPVAHLQVKTTELRSAIAGLPKERQPLFEAYLRRLRTSFGVYAVGGRALRIEGCAFRFQSSEFDVFGAAVFGTRSVRGLEVIDNVVEATEAQATPFAALASGQETDGAVQI